MTRTRVEVREEGRGVEEDPLNKEEREEDMVPPPPVRVIIPGNNREIDRTGPRSSNTSMQRDLFLPSSSPSPKRNARRLPSCYEPLILTLVSINS